MMLSNEKEMIIQQIDTKNSHEEILKILRLLFLSKYCCLLCNNASD